MTKLNLNNQMPGILSLFTFSPETASPMRDLAEILLVKDSPLSRAERELIASYTSYLNQCYFCYMSHSHAAEALNPGYGILVDKFKNLSVETFGKKSYELLKLAALVQKDAKQVTPSVVADLKKNGFSDKEIHDAVLIASAFCMFNRYVDALAENVPQGRDAYIPMGKMLAEMGYART